LDLSGALVRALKRNKANQTGVKIS